MEFEKSEALRVFDGAIGTEVQKRVSGFDENLTEVLNLNKPELIQGIHLDYLEAGAEFLTTNTFSANEIRLGRSNYEHRSREINERGASLARKAIEEFAGDSPHGRFVAGSIGPTGETLVPLGDHHFSEFYGAFLNQARGLKNGGADWIIIETMESLREAKAALLAASQVGLPVISSLSYGERGRTSYGVVPSAGAVTLDHLGADVLAMNCGTGPSYYPELISTYSEFTARPLLAEANAGDPELKGGEAVYDLTPEKYLEDIKPGLSDLAGVGSCCGSDPNFTRALAEAASESGRRQKKNLPEGRKFFSSNAKVVSTGEVSEFDRFEVPSDNLKSIRKLKDPERVSLVEINAEDRSEEELEAEFSRVFLQLGSAAPTGIKTEDPITLKSFLRAYPGIPPIDLEGGNSSLMEIAQEYGGLII
mgnify:CR=1 FL=1